MKTNPLIFLGYFLLVLTFIACEKSDSGSADKLGGAQSTMGEVGNEFEIISTPYGVGSLSAEVTDLSDGVSTVTYTGIISDANYKAMLSNLAGASINDNQVTVTERYRITTEGMESVFDEGSIILVKYDANVGDVYKLGNLKREVVHKSTEDDYYWNFMYIKTIQVEETGRNIPGVSKIVYIFNHRFGIVGLSINFEDGSTYQTGIASYN
ncbi:MAG TPA: hypothetical protein DDX98_09375 [Bacteroidales bacterium]|jgi:signal peptidase I|nr:hypothetical protein [Bacteroidales bacterium]